MLVVFSDVHANREALAAVLEAALRLNPSRLICLGDVVGYGPDPEWCIDAVQSACEVVLCGNHDYAVVYGAEDFNVSAESAIRYHRALLMPLANQPDPGGRKRKRWDFLKALPHRHTEDGMLFVHGSPRNPTWEYLREADVRWGLTKKLTENFELVESFAFVGHTHRPGVLTSDLRFLRPDRLGGLYRADPGEKVIINVGSVGQPRDNDPRACFVSVDGREVRFHRVQYDVQATARKIERSGVISLELAHRLVSGT